MENPDLNPFAVEEVYEAPSKTVSYKTMQMNASLGDVDERRYIIVTTKTMQMTEGISH